MKISAIVPVYNSGKIISGTYKNVKKELKKITKDYEILFRNDASKDRSLEILKKIAQKDRKVRIFSNSRNRGLGFTLRKLFNDAKGDYIIYFDADAYLCFDLLKLKPLLKKAENYDAVIASRYIKNSVLPLYRWFASEVYSTINKILFGMEIRDIGSGLVIFKRKAIRNVNLVSDGFDIHIEIFSKLAKKNYKIEEIPIKYKHWEGGSFNVLKHGPKTLVNTFKLWFKMTGG